MLIAFGQRNELSCPLRRYHWGWEWVEMQGQRETATTKQRFPSIVSRPCTCSCYSAQNQNVSVCMCIWKAQGRKETGDNFPTAKWHKTARFKFLPSFPWHERPWMSITADDHHCRSSITATVRADEAHTFLLYVVVKVCEEEDSLSKERGKLHQGVLKDGVKRRVKWAMCALSATSQRRSDGLLSGQSQWTHTSLSKLS